MLPSNAADFEVLEQQQRKKTGRRIGGLAVMLGLLVILIGVVAVAVTRLPTGVLSRPGTAAAPAQATPRAAAANPAAAAAPAGTPADAATQAAIQDVIQKLDNAQAQAIASKDPQVMAATATAEFYQEQVATNQDLTANGVTEIKLINLEWGAVTVNGNTATATVFETWSTTFDDGTTEQARDRNVYTLVLDNGTWKVQADDHPDQAAPATGN
jgi:hypothetical protein